MAKMQSQSLSQVLTPAQKLGGRRIAWLVICSLPMLVFLGLPLLALVLRVPLPQLLANATDPAVAQALSLSITTTVCALLLTILTGTPVALLLARRRFRGRNLLDTLIELPIVLPPSVAGIALLVAFGRRGLVGQHLSVLGFELAFTSTAVVLAQVFVSAPLFIKSASAGFAEVDRELELAAELDGASRWQVFRYISMPLAWTSLLSGAVMSWSRALGEFGATIIFAGNFVGRTQTMPLAIYQAFEHDLNLALTLAVILLVLSFGVLFLVKVVLRR